MNRKIAAILAVGALAGALLSPAHAVAKKKARPLVMTQYLNWGGDCGGAGYLALSHTANPDSCALFFPEVASEHYFAGSQGMPFVLDADQDVTVDFTLNSVVTAAAEFQATLTATVGGEQVDVASATTTVQVARGATPVHFDLEPARALDNAKVSALNLTITWTDGITYSSIDLDSGTAQLVARGFK